MAAKRPNGLAKTLATALLAGAAACVAPALAQEAAGPGAAGELGLRRGGASRDAGPPARVARPVRAGGREGVRRRTAGPVRAPVVVMPEPVPPPPSRRARPEEDPFAPPGLKVGGVTLYPDLGASAGYDTNPNRSSGRPKGSAVYRTEGGLAIRSDWPAHELRGELRGAYNVYPDAPEADRPEGSGRIGLRLDATRDTRIDLETRFRADTQRPGSPDLATPVRRRPLVSSFGASAGVTERFNRLQLGLKGTVDRTAYEDAELPDGTILRQRDRNQTQAGLQLRAGYELTPGVVPFVEALADARRYDDRADGAGFERGSTGVGLRAGSSFELTRTLTGEVAAGVQRRRYDDERLKDLRGPIADASLVWSASPLTTVRLRGSSQIAETTLAGSSGAFAHAGTLEVQHDLRRNLSLVAAATLSRVDYDGTALREDGLAGSLRLDYRVTRSLVLRASFTHERLRSSAPGSDYTANVYLVGLRLQR